MSSMTHAPPRPRRKSRPTWTQDGLVRRRAILLGYCVAPTTATAYSSALASYIDFCDRHKFPLEPTPDTLSFYIAYLSVFLKPNTIASYLSGICNKLEPFFPSVRTVRQARLVSQTLKGARRMCGTPDKRKRPLTADDIKLLTDKFGNAKAHDDKLLLAAIMVGFHGLLRVSELTQPSVKAHRDPRKLMLRHTVEETASHITLVLPGHKADQFLAGHNIILQRLDDFMDPSAPFLNYLSSRDKLFPLHPHLWLRQDGSVPTFTWMVNRIKSLFEGDVGGSSIRSGGATHLAICGASHQTIQAVGRWSSEAYRVYLRKHPIVVQSAIWSRPVLSATPHLPQHPL